MCRNLFYSRRLTNDLFLVYSNRIDYQSLSSLVSGLNINPLVQIRRVDPSIFFFEDKKYPRINVLPNTDYNIRYARVKFSRESESSCESSIVSNIAVVEFPIQIRIDYYFLRLIWIVS